MVLGLRRALLLGVLLALVGAACGGSGKLGAKALSQQSKLLHSEAAEGALLAQDAVAPHGLIHHFATRTEDGFVIFEVWESQEDFDSFSEEKLQPALDKVSGGQAPQASPTFGELHNEFHGQNELAAERFETAASTSATEDPGITRPGEESH